MVKTDKKAGGGALLDGVLHHQRQLHAVLADFGDPAMNYQRHAGMAFGQIAHLQLARDQRGDGIGAEGVAHPGEVSQSADGLRGLGDVEAHIHVPQLIAFPCIRVAAPQLLHADLPPIVCFQEVRTVRPGASRVTALRTAPVMLQYGARNLETFGRVVGQGRGVLLAHRAAILADEKFGNLVAMPVDAGHVGV